MKHRSRKLRLLRFLPGHWARTVGPHAPRTLYLSFDDGPDPAHTPRLLDLLAAHDVRATFFLIGNRVEQYPDLARRISREGHLLGNHSHTHPHFDKLSLAEQLAEVERADHALKAIDGNAIHPFRPPRGVVPTSMLLHFIRKGRRLTYWSYDSLDYSKQPVPELAAQMRRQPPRAGDIVLMHDDNGISIDLLHELIPEWKRSGFSFDALPADVAPTAHPHE